MSTSGAAVLTTLGHGANEMTDECAFKVHNMCPLPTCSCECHDVDLSNEIDLELTKREAQDYADELGLGDIPYVVMVPDCQCNAHLDDSTEILKCPKCDKPGVQRS